MNFIDGVYLKYRKQGLSEDDIRIKLRKYYFFSKVALVLYVLVFVLSILLGRFRVADISAMIVFFACFAAILRMFLLLRKWVKFNGEF